MPNLSTRRLSACGELLAGLAQAASAAEIPIVDAKSQPESLIANGKICQLPSGASTAELFLEDRALYGISTVSRWTLPARPDNPVDIWMDRPVKGPDGMRAANGKLLLAGNGSGRISVITVNGAEGQRHGNQGRAQDTNRSRARGRHDLGRRTRRWQGSVYSDAEMMERDW